MTKAFTVGEAKQNTEELFRLCGRLYYITSTYGIQLPYRVAQHLPSFGVDWTKVQHGKSASYVEGLAVVADKLYQEGKSGGEVINPVTESREVLRRIFLEHIIPHNV